MAFNENEKAVLVVNGRRFEDWKSVQVVHRAQEAFPTAVFECTEAVSDQASAQGQRVSDVFWSALQIKPGEFVWSILERLARSRQIVLGSTQKGNLYAIGRQNQLTEDKLVEGGNILEANCTIDDRYVMSKYFEIGQRAGSDENWGSAVSELTAVAPGSTTRYKPWLNVMEHPETPDGVRKRAEFERLIHEGTLISAPITVQGWLRQSGDLWRTNRFVTVKSPMLLLDMALGVSEIVFKQTEGGTTTTLTLVRPEALNNFINMSPNQGAQRASLI